MAFKIPFKIPVIKIPAIKIPVSPAALGGGLVAVVCMVGFVFYVQRGAHIELKGSVLKGAYAADG